MTEKTTRTVRAYVVTESSREILQDFIVEMIPEDTTYVIVTKEGYTFINEKIPAVITDVDGHLRINMPRMRFLSYHEVEIEED